MSRGDFQPMLLHIERNVSLQVERNEVTRCWIINEHGTYRRWTAWVMAYDNAFFRAFLCQLLDDIKQHQDVFLHLTTLLTCCHLSVNANRTISLYASHKPSNQHFEIIFLLLDSTLPHGINRKAALIIPLNYTQSAYVGFRKQKL